MLGSVQKTVEDSLAVAVVVVVVVAVAVAVVAVVEDVVVVGVVGHN
jgi:hypothetical protein